MGARLPMTDVGSTQKPDASRKGLSVDWAAVLLALALAAAVKLELLRAVPW